MAVLSWWSDLSVNERDLSLLTSQRNPIAFDFLEGLCGTNTRKFEAITGL
jgi:hypothetical protein